MTKTMLLMVIGTVLTLAGFFGPYDHGFLEGFGLCCIAYGYARKG